MITMSDQLYINFDEYIRQGEPAQRERADSWRVAIGLQAVDGLKTSEYLQETARRNIEGEISIDEACELVKQYYISKTTHDEDDADKEEADRVSGNIAKLLQTDAFTYSVAGFAAIHRAIFEGVFKHAGRFRDYDISKKEWVLQWPLVRTMQEARGLSRYPTDLRYTIPKGWHSLAKCCHIRWLRETTRTVPLLSGAQAVSAPDRKSTRLNSSHQV